MSERKCDSYILGYKISIPATADYYYYFHPMGNSKPEMYIIFINANARRVQQLAAAAYITFSTVLIV